jgi:serine/threonine protein kinase
MAPRFRPNMTIGKWTLVKRLGTGGNGEVWRVTGPDGAVAALKLLKRVQYRSDQYRRFQDEVRCLENLGRYPGILPLIEANLPARETERDHPWLAMPEATPLQAALGRDADLRNVVAAMAEIAASLEQLVSQGITHRDIKPSNLYFYEGKYVLGDFGLVAFPGKQALTQPRRWLGPKGYLAPEMIMHPESAAGGPADVYSLAKTIWVLASGEAWPPPGEQRLDIRELLLEHRTGHHWSYLLDRLIAKSTRFTPGERPMMAEVRDELLAWGQLSMQFPMPDPFGVRWAVVSRQETETLLMQELSELKHKLTRSEVTSQDLNTLKILTDCGIDNADDRSRDNQGHYLMLSKPSHQRVLYSGWGIQELNGENQRIVVAHVLEHGTDGPRQVLWSKQVTVPLGGAMDRLASVSLISELCSELDNVLDSL